MHRQKFIMKTIKQIVIDLKILVAIDFLQILPITM